VFCWATAARALDITPVSDPEALGFSSSRLARIATWQQSQVDAGAISGAVAAIARNGKVAYLRAVGFNDRAKTIPLTPDAIFWIASMTKPVTSVAAMMLVEEGKLDLAAPVHQYLPELRDMMVAVETKDPVTGKTELAREPQKRPMTVEDLLRHTAGLASGGGPTEVHRLYGNPYGNAGVFRRDRTLADFISALARLPLAYQPGEVWEYGPAVDVLSRVIEVASGQPFDRFLETRLFEPLGMVDTGCHVPEAKLSRLIDPPAGGRPPVWDVTRPTAGRGRCVLPHRDLTYGAFRIPDQGVPAPAVAPVAIDPATLAAFAGTYRFSSTSSRDQQAPNGDARRVRGFGGLGIELAIEDGRVKVVSPVANAPAARAGVMANDEASASTRRSRSCAAPSTPRPASRSCARGRRIQSRCRSSAP
jgi:CubicO group peptidase (beta-lactamase class C family)